MNLAELKPSTIVVEIRHPATQAPTGLVLTCASLEAEAPRRVRREQMNEALRTRQRTLTAETIEANTIELYAATIAAWRWDGDATWGDDGQKPDLSPAVAREVMAVTWIRSQVVEAVDDVASFFQS